MAHELHACEPTDYQNRSTINSTRCQHNEFKNFCYRMVLDDTLETIRTLRALPKKSTFMPLNLTEKMFHWTPNVVLTGNRRSVASDLTLILRTTTAADIFQHKKSIDLQNIENLLYSIRFDAKEAVSKLRECKRVLFFYDQAKNLNDEYKKRHSSLIEALKGYTLNAINRKNSTSIGGQLTQKYLVINPIKDRYFLRHQFTHEDMMIYKIWEQEEDLKAQSVFYQQKHKYNIKIASSLESYYIEQLNFLRVIIEEKSQEYVEILDKVDLEINSKKTELQDLRRTFKHYQQLIEEYREKVRQVLIQEWQKQLNRVSQ